MGKRNNYRKATNFIENTAKQNLRSSSSSNGLRSIYYGASVKERVQPGDLVVAGIWDQESMKIMFFRIGEVIFANAHYCTVKFQYHHPVTGSVALKDTGTNEAKTVCYTYDIADFNYKVIKKCYVENGICRVESGNNPLYLNEKLNQKQTFSASLGLAPRDLPMLLVSVGKRVGDGADEYEVEEMIS